MSKPFTYWVRLTLVATLCTLTTFSPALAGKFIDRLLNRDCASANNNCCEIVVPECQGVPTCEMPTPSDCCAPAPCSPVTSCAPSVPATACDSMVDSDAAPTATAGSAALSTPESKKPVETAPVTGTAVEPSNASTTPAVVDTIETKPAKVEDTKSTLDISKPEEPAATTRIENAAPVTPAVPVTETPKVIEAPPVTEAPAAPIVKEAPAADPFSEPATPKIEAPAAEEAAKVTPAQEAPAKEEPKKLDADDLFGESSSKAPAIEQPAAETPAVTPPAKANESIDDIFGSKPETGLPPATAPKDAPPASTPPAEANALDSLFGEPSTPKAETKSPAKDAVDDLFGEPAPTKEAPKAPAKESLDDLFGEPAGASKDAPAATPPAATPPAATPPAATPPAADPSLDDLFGKPVSTEEKPQSTGDGATSEGLFDDLFAPKQPAAPTDTPTKTPAAPKNNADELDKLFGIGSFTAPSQFNGAEFKTWVDNTGTYTVKGRLAVIYSDKVKLLKENGKFTTVPLDRLSDRDFEYVQWVASNLSPNTSTKFVKKDTSSPESENVR